MPGLRRAPVRAQRAMSARLTGAASSTIIAVDTAATSITSDIDIRVLAALDTWVPAAACTIISKDAAANRSYNLYLNTDGKLHLFMTSNGTSTSADATCSAATGFAAKTKHWVRATWSNSGDLVKFYDAPGNLKNPIAADFTQMGTDIAAALTGIFDGTANVEIGGCFAGSTFLLTNGNVYRAQIRNGIDGTLVADFDPSVLKIVGARRPTFFTDAVGQIWYTANAFLPSWTGWDWSTS